jgi:hypothetical protein
VSVLAARESPEYQPRAKRIHGQKTALALMSAARLTNYGGGQIKKIVELLEQVLLLRRIEVRRIPFNPKITTLAILGMDLNKHVGFRPWAKHVVGIEIPQLVHKSIIGPTQYLAATHSALCYLLEEAGVSNPGERIVVSEVPLRT